MTLCGGWLQSSSLLSHGPLRRRQRVSVLFGSTHVGSLGHVVMSLADTASVPHSVARLFY